jgi:hypothetical protein
MSDEVSIILSLLAIAISLVTIGMNIGMRK